MSHRPTPVRVAAATVLTAVATGVLLRLPRVEVAGPSMLPTLLPGDRLLVLPVPPRAGRLVVVRDPRRPERRLVKRAAQMTDGAVVVRGDNPAASTDSRHLGPIDRRLVVGRPVHRYAPEGRAGWVWRA